MHPLVLFGIAIAAFAAFMIYGAIAADQRGRMLSAWAASKGLSYTSSNDYGMQGRFPDFECLRKGEERYAYNIVRGVWNDRACYAFDYHYETYTQGKNGRQTHHHHFSAVVVTSDIPLQSLVIRPETVFDKVAEFVGFADINFESAEFSRRFYVSAPSKKWAYDVLHARTLEFLLQMPDFNLQFADRHVIAYRNSRFEIADIEAAIETIRGILDRLPEYVVKQQRGE